MAKLLYGLGIALMVAAIAGAVIGSRAGWGLSGLLDEPVSVRQESVSRSPGSPGPRFIYFGGSSRRHAGGGFRHGK